MKFKEVINEESNTIKPFFGTADGKSWAVKIQGLENQDFPIKGFGRSMSDRRKAIDFQTAPGVKKGYADAKGKATLPAVKKWIKEVNPSEFYASWQSDSSFYKNDSVVIYYKP